MNHGRNQDDEHDHTQRRPAEQPRVAAMDSARTRVRSQGQHKNRVAAGSEEIHDEPLLQQALLG